MNGRRNGTARRRPRAIAGYPLPRAGTLEGDQRLDNDDLYVMSYLELYEERIAVRHALLHLSQSGDRLLCCCPWPLSVAEWLMARAAAIDERLGPDDQGFDPYQTAGRMRRIAGECDFDLPGDVAGGSL